jgi:uncharacterized membrane protein YfcA
LTVAGTSLATTVAIWLAGLGAGIINSVAGGGTLLSFPVLLWAGRDPISANISNALALGPGSLAGAYGFRREMARSRRLLALLIPPAVLGGAAGSWLLLRTTAGTFQRLIPYLVLMATVVVAFQGPLKRLGREGTPSGWRAAALCVVQLCVSFYGGYFGAAMGILMLAALAVYGVADIHERNGLKNVLAAVTNVVASIYFVVAGSVVWKDAALLAFGSIAGGYLGASVGRRLRRETAERVVVVIGLVMTAALFLRRR